jgi:hypothetical protein
LHTCLAPVAQDALLQAFTRLLYGANPEVISRLTSADVFFLFRAMGKSLKFRPTFIELIGHIKRERDVRQTVRNLSIVSNRSHSG